MVSFCFVHNGVISQLHFTKCKSVLSESLLELVIWSEALLHSFQGFQNTESHSSRKDSLAPQERAVSEKKMMLHFQYHDNGFIFLLSFGRIDLRVIF